MLAPAPPVAFRLVVMLFRHGWPHVGAGGGRRVWWRGTISDLSRLVGASKPHVLAAERRLSESGFLTVHAPTRARSPHAISAPVDPPTGNKLLPGPEAEFPQHADDLLISTSPSVSEGITTTTPAATSDTICYRLAEFGVTDPAAWIDRFGAERCEAVVEHFETLGPERFTNPPGMLYHLLTSRQRFGPRVRVENPDAAVEERYARWLGGALGHVVRYK